MPPQGPWLAPSAHKQSTIGSNVDGLYWRFSAQNVRHSVDFQQPANAGATNALYRRSGRRLPVEEARFVPMRSWRLSLQYRGPGGTISSNRSRALSMGTAPRGSGTFFGRKFVRQVDLNRAEKGTRPLPRERLRLPWG